VEDEGHLLLRVPVDREARARLERVLVHGRLGRVDRPPAQPCEGLADRQLVERAAARLPHQSSTKATTRQGEASPPTIGIGNAPIRQRRFSTCSMSPPMFSMWVTPARKGTLCITNRSSIGNSSSGSIPVFSWNWPAISGRHLVRIEVFSG